MPEFAPTVTLDMPDETCFAFSEQDGLFKLLADLGTEVASGAPLARLWLIDRTGTAPLTVAAPRSGIVASRHFPGLIQAGDRLAVIADVVD
jgi:N-alpha-acetyl-L-2,4-diaminobutyrate deacetylase